jgi:hypothetical protein
MMPTFPRSPFHFVRRVFPSTAGRLAFQAVPSWIIKPAPGMRRPTSSSHLPFVHLVVSTVVPLCAGSPTRLRTAVEGHYSSAQGAGQKRKCPGSRGTSVLPSGADMSACPGMSVWCQTRTSATRIAARRRPTSRGPSLSGNLCGSVSDNAQQVLTGHSLFTEKPCSRALRFGSYGFKDVCASYHGAA